MGSDRLEATALLHRTVLDPSRGHWTRLRSPLIASSVLSLVIGLIVAASPPSVAAAVPCPEPPVTVAELIALEEEIGPLTLEFDPIYGVYAERALACFGDRPLEIDAFLASPEGLGGVRSFTMEPAWVTSSAWFVAVDDELNDEGFAEGPFMPVAVPPELEGGFVDVRGRWVRLRGQFDDPVAQTCQIASSSPELGAVPTADEAIEICRTSFVVDTLSVTAGPPAAQPTPPRTDTVVGLGASIGAEPPMHVPFLLLAGVVGAVLGAFRDRRPGVSRA